MLTPEGSHRGRDVLARRVANVYTPEGFQWPGPRTVFAYVTTDL